METPDYVKCNECKTKLKSYLFKKDKDGKRICPKCKSKDTKWIGVYYD